MFERHPCTETFLFKCSGSGQILKFYFRVSSQSTVNDVNLRPILRGEHETLVIAQEHEKDKPHDIVPVMTCVMEFFSY